MRHVLSRRVWGVAAIAALTATGCDGNGGPTAPLPVLTPPPGQPTGPPSGSNTIRGTVWVHNGTVRQQLRGGSLFGWIEMERLGYTTGRIAIDASGRFSLSAPADVKRVRLMVSEHYQPCAVTLTPGGDVEHDIHVVSDPLRLGGQLPTELLATTPTLSGQVFEITTEGHRPVAETRVELDGFGGMGLVIATTLTDTDGRYVLCGVPHLPGLHLFASKPGFQLYETGEILDRSTFDIELRRRDR